MNRSHLQDDGLRISVKHSPNVFLERLADMVALETPMIITNNQQGLLFVWPRTSGLEIAVQVTGVYLVPEYRDVDAKDDTKLFSKLVDVRQSIKDYYAHAQENFCRHPVPDYYSLQLMQKDRESAAQVVVCDSKDPKIPKCPPKYKDGDRFVHRSINKACPKIGKAKLKDRLVDLDNSVVCSDETDLLHDLYSIMWPDSVREYKFLGPNCLELEAKCSNCLDTAGCPSIEIRNYTFSLEDNRCCGIKCFNQSHCKAAYSASCPEAKVECARGIVDIFSLFPRFETMEREFSCHLEYAPPEYLYSLNYAIRVPSIGLNISEKHFAVTPTSPEDHERRLSRFDFIQGFHDTRFPVLEELILQGDHAELSIYNNLFKPYRARPIKSAEELQKKAYYTTDRSSMMTYVQFERPFLYSSSTWKRDGCYKNMTQIYPNQTIYGEEQVPVLARKTKLTKSPADTEVKKFSYQMHHADMEPYVKFFVDAKESVLQYLQGSAVHGILVPSSLYGRVTWHHDSSTWQLLFAGRQMNCPTVISLKIFTQMMTGCAGHFDILINCPEDFTVTFNLTTAVSDLPDVFVLQANDSRTSHNLVLSSLYSPLQVDELASRSSAELSRKLGEGVVHQNDNGRQRSSQFIVHVWLPLLAVVITALIMLLVIYACYSYINANIPRIDYKGSMGNGNVGNAPMSPANSSGTSNPTNNGGNVEPPIIVVALNNQGEKANHVTTTTTIATAKDKVNASKTVKEKSEENQESSQRPRCIIVVFVILYILYSLVFSFSATFGTLYLTQAQIWSNVSNPENLAQELHVEVDRALSEIQDFENVERERIFDSFLERRRACVRHLELENSRLLKDYDATMKKQLHTIFVQNGTLHRYTAEIQRQNVSAYISQITQFVQDCNKTVNSIVDLFKANYMRFLRNTAHNEWLEVPRQIFLRQEGDSNIFSPYTPCQAVCVLAGY
ncbi:LOW QUALITY PROTEIN: hypothetical protein ElyMa_000875400 [Elysia marginata]|uniref:Uncharacterized protein n=1 Tax=Elysia marginata TaxID=1093978 RepID=A0AAV4H655_9GAST|nr:LOW QUALITY PROTEIN: hypothetical protein ElyMa_000875400 [Elysia marginata]